jgi:hypothetical protein
VALSEPDDGAERVEGSYCWQAARTMGTFLREEEVEAVNRS